MGASIAQKDARRIRTGDFGHQRPPVLSLAARRAYMPSCSGVVLQGSAAYVCVCLCVLCVLRFIWREHNVASMVSNK